MTQLVIKETRELILAGEISKAEANLVVLAEQEGDHALVEVLDEMAPKDVLAVIREYDASKESVVNLRVAYSPNGLLVLYGNTAAGDLFTAYQSQIGGAFAGTVTGMGGNLSQGDFHLAMTDESDWQLAANVSGTPVLYTGQLGATEASSGPAPMTQFEGTLKQIVMSYWSTSQQTLLYLLVNDQDSLHVWATNSANSARRSLVSCGPMRMP